MRMSDNKLWQSIFVDLFESKFMTKINELHLDLNYILPVKTKWYLKLLSAKTNQRKELQEE